MLHIVVQVQCFIICEVKFALFVVGIVKIISGRV